MLLSKELHKYIYWLGLALLIIGLPLSKFIMSLSLFILGINWLVSGDMKEKLFSVWYRKELLFIAGIFVIHLIGLIWTEDFNYGWNDIRKKLPLFIYPVVLAYSKYQLKKDIFIKLITLFVLVVIVATIVSMFKYLGIFCQAPNDPRELSIFSSHIRFGLIINIAIFSSFYIYQNATSKSTYFWLIIALWLVAFNFILQSLTSLMVLVILMIIALFFWPASNKHVIKYKKVFAGFVLLFMILAAVKVGQYSYEQLVPKEKLAEAKKKQSKNGEWYYHVPDSKILENGHYLYLNIASKELEQAWAERSNIVLKSGKDHRGQELRATLIRFLTSKGLEKDREGVMQLTEEEIKAIESGIANVLYVNCSPLELRVRETIWEIGTYYAGKNPSGNTLSQRFEYWKNAVCVIKDNWLIGVGTGDVKKEEMAMYEKTNSIIEEAYRRRAHNQYLTIGVALGILGLLYFLFSLFYPFFVVSIKKYPLYYMVLISSIMTFINEDPLETQTGVTFFAGLLSFFLLHGNESIPDNKSA